MKETKIMRIGTRRSALAVEQTRLFVERMRVAAPDAAVSYEVVEMNTAGDRISDRPLYEFSGKGMFVSAFEMAIAHGEIDAAVHSGKDMPGETAAGLTVAAVLPRGNPRDVLVTMPGKRLTARSVIGTGSLRRQEQVKRLLGYGVKPVRGNVNTRLQKLQDGEVDGLILAAAGLERLALLPKSGEGGVLTPPRSGLCAGGMFCYRELPEQEFLPAAAQGIIAVESRADGPFAALIRQVNDAGTMRCFLAERMFLSQIGAGCQQPVAAYSRCADGMIDMWVEDWEAGGPFRFSGCAAAAHGEELAASLAEKIRIAKAGSKEGPE